jgi:hypothetical protein
MTVYIYRFALVLGILFFGAQAFAQKDLIITQAGEEIRCKILDETPSRFIYAYLGPKNKVLRNEIFKNLVSSFKYSFYSSDILINDKTIKGSQAHKVDPMKPQSTPNDSSPAKSKSKVKKEEALIQPPVKNEKTASKSTADSSKLSNSAPTVISTDKKNESEKESNAVTKNNTEEKKVTPNKDTEKSDITPKEEAKTEEALKNETTKNAESPLAEPEPTSEFKNYLKYRVGAKGGLGNIVAKNTDTSPYGLFQEKLLRGWMFGVDAAYFFKDNIGFGATYTNFQANNKSDKIDYPDLFSGEKVTNGSLSKHISHKFVGPTFLYRRNIDFKTFAIITLSPGMHLYTDKGVANAANYTFKGQSYGGAATLGLDFLLGNDIFGRDIILSLEGGYNYGKITQINKNDGKGNIALPTPINLNRLDFTIGLRFTRFPMYLS